MTRFGYCADIHSDILAPASCNCFAMQANTKWFEGAANQSIYWSISDDGGLTWGPTRVLLPSPDTLPIWGPVQHAEVSTPASAARSDL